MKYFKWGFNSHELPLLAQEPREMPGLYSDEKKLVFGVPELKSFWYIYICSIRLKTRRKKLKYVDFVQVVPIYVVVCFSSVYRYAKENSGPLNRGSELSRTPSELSSDRSTTSSMMSPSSFSNSSITRSVFLFSNSKSISQPGN